MIRSDNHVHTSFSSDSKEPLENMLQQAITTGFQSICITDHMDYDFPEIEPGMNYQFDADRYLAHLEKARSQFSDLEIRQGVELGLKPSVQKKALTLTSSYPFDFVIGSTHLVDDIDPYYDLFWENQKEETAILKYYEATLENISLPFDFDVYGHLDYILRYTPTVKKMRAKGFIDEDYLLRQTKNAMEIIDEILRLLIDQGHGIELNTAGLKYGMGHPNPNEQILTRYRELGGELITIGSDAHAAKHLGYRFDLVPTILAQCGFRYYTEYKSRKPIMHPVE